MAPGVRAGRGTRVHASELPGRRRPLCVLHPAAIDATAIAQRTNFNVRIGAYSHVLRAVLEHSVCGLHGTRIHLVSFLSLDHVDELLNNVNV